MSLSETAHCKLMDKSDKSIKQCYRPGVKRIEHKHVILDGLEMQH